MASSFKKIFGGMFGSNDPRYRTASPRSMLLGCATSGGKTVFMMLMSYAGYMANAGYGILVMLTGIIMTVKTIFDGVCDPVVAAVFDRMKVGKLGKVRKFLLIGYGVTVVSAILMFHILANRFDGALGVFMYCAHFALFIVGYTILSIGTTTIPAILTNDPKQRPFMNFAATCYQFLAPIILNALMAFLILPRHGNQYDAACLGEACYVYSAVALLFMTLSIIGIAPVDNEKNLGELMSLGGKHKIGFKDMWNMVKVNKPLRCYSEQYQCLYHEYILGCIARHPWLWATHAWNMFDFAADGRDEGGTHGLNQKGLVSFDRKLKKDAFYLYKAAWNKTEPFVHLCGSRYVNRAEAQTEIKAYSNQAQVTLFMDGREIAAQTGETVFSFKVSLTGEHTVTAVAGDCRDTIAIRKADAPDPAYRFGKTGGIANWFDEAEFKTDCFSIRDSFGALTAHPEAGKIVGAIMEKMRAKRGEVAQSAGSNPNLQRMMAGMSFEALLKKGGDAVPESLARQINEQLQKIRKC